MLSGTHATDPVIDATATGMPTATARLLLSEDRNGQTFRVYVPIEAWGYTAEVLGDLQEGDPVIIDGRIKWRSWDKVGAERRMLVVSAGRLQALSGAATRREGS